jgi:hypothetical protein
MPAGLRATVFDPSRNCLWILTRFFREAGAPLATLTAFNVGTGSVDLSGMELPAQGFIRGNIALGANGVVWMAWGKTLVSYDPNSRVTKSWSLPVVTNVVVDAVSPVFDGNIVALAIASNNEIWTVAHGVHALFGFNPSTTMWDRQVPLPLSPTVFSHLAFSSQTNILVDGLEPGPVSALAAVDITSGRASELATSIRAYAGAGNNTAIFVDDANALGVTSLATGSRNMVNVTVPATPDPHLAVDEAGNGWLTLTTIGVGKLAVGSIAYTAYPLPQILSHGSLACGVPPCQPGSVVAIDPQIQSITFDHSGDVWVTTSLQGGSPFNPGLPLLELIGAG